MITRKVTMTVVLGATILGLNILYNNAGNLNPFEAMVGNKLPAGVPATAKTESLCFVPGEKQALSEWATSASNSVSFGLCDNKPFINPIKIIRGNQYYTAGSSGSTFDCLRYRRNYAYTENIRMAYTQLSEYADVMMNSAQESDRIRGAMCLARIYLHWAEQDGLGRLEYSGDSQPDFTQLWATSAIASVYARYKKPVDEHAKKFVTFGGKVYAGVINAWLERMGARILTQITKQEKRYPTKALYEAQQNNMSYWRGYALLSTAVHTQNLKHIQKSEEIFGIGLSHVTDGPAGFPNSDKGYLPLELQRGSRALAYHQFSLQPLAGMANLSAAMKCDFLKTDQNIWKMALLIRKTTEGNRNPSVFRDAAFCEINNSCEKASVIQRSALEQTAGGNGEPYFPLITNKTHKETIRQRVIHYLISKNITFVDYTGKSQVASYLGGDIRYAPKYGSLMPNKKDVKLYCQAKK